jgi:hypothetical protein
LHHPSPPRREGAEDLTSPIELPAPQAICPVVEQKSVCGAVVNGLLVSIVPPCFGRTELSV